MSSPFRNPAARGAAAVVSLLSDDDEDNEGPPRAAVPLGNISNKKNAPNNSRVTAKPSVATANSNSSVAAAAAAAAVGAPNDTVLSAAQQRALAEAQANAQAKQEAKDVKKVQLELDRMFDKHNREKFNGVPMLDLPAGFKDSVKLFDYQKQGISWLVHQEKNVANRVGPFWKFRKDWNRWQDKITLATRLTPPEGDRGAILADEMGLGKSLQTLGLVLGNMPNIGPKCTMIVCPVSVISSWQMQVEQFVQSGYLTVEVYTGKDRHKLLNKIKRNNSVDIMLTSYETIMSDWNNYREYHDEKEEAKAAVAKKKKKGRDEMAAAWNGGDDSEEDFEPDSDSDDDDDHYLPASMTRKRKAPPKKNGPWLFEIEFFRIVLDEGHKIRNTKTKFFISTKAILAEHKLVLTATPFVNRISDIYALISFLAAGHSSSNPLVESKQFKEYVTKPIIEFKEVGLSRVRMLMGHLALRRTKDDPSVDIDQIELPPLTTEIYRVEWAEKGVHAKSNALLYGVARETFLNMLHVAKTHGGKAIYGHWLRFFTLVLRVRQSCCSAALIPDEAIEDAKLAKALLEEEEGMGAIEMDEDEALALLTKLFAIFQKDEKIELDNLDNECAICLDDIEEETASVLRACKHVFCEDCLVNMNNSGNSACALCRSPFKPRDIFKIKDVQEVQEEAKKKASKSEEKTGRLKRDDDDEDLDADEQAPKILALIEKIEEMKPDEKGVIFSQWTSFLDLIQEAMVAAGHDVTRIDGSMNPEQRFEAMYAFQSNDKGSPRFILASLHAAGTGITLHRGSWCFSMDNWWNYAIENQAFARIHRIGQTRPCRIVRFVMKDSIEERMIDVQDCKTALGQGSLRRLTKEERKKARITALKDLFQVQPEETTWQGYFKDEENEDDNGDDLDDFIVDDDVED